MNGFIKLDRGIFDWEWYTEQDTSRMFIHLLLKANHKKAKVNGKVVERGQTITSIPKLSDQLCMSFFKVRKALANLKETGEISIETTNNYSLVTISKYNKYQGFYETSTTDEKQSDDSQNTTNNKDNNDIEDNINISQWQKNYLSNQRLIDSVSRENKMDIEFIKKGLISFVKTQMSVDNIEQSTIEFNRHFLNYLRKMKSSVVKSYSRGKYDQTAY